MNFKTDPQFLTRGSSLARAWRALLILFLITLAQVAFGAPSEMTANDESDEVTFRLPSTLSIAGSQSSSETMSSMVAARLMLPKNFWIEVSMDRATESTDGLETKTLGLSGTVGTNPISDYSVDLGVDAFGVDDQYNVREGRARITAMPMTVFGLENPGVEVSAEYRGSEFEFANTPNPIFSSNQVRLAVQTFRMELSLYMFSPWTLRFYGERAQLADAFKDLNRVLAPLFIPETAISTAVSWPGEEDGMTLSYGGKSWSARVSAARKKASVTEDKTFTSAIAFDYAWTKKISTGVRYANAKSEDDSSLSPIETVGLDIQLTF